MVSPSLPCCHQRVAGSRVCLNGDSLPEMSPEDKVGGRDERWGPGEEVYNVERSSQ